MRSMTIKLIQWLGGRLEMQIKITYIDKKNKYIYRVQIQIMESGKGKMEIGNGNGKGNLNGNDNNVVSTVRSIETKGAL